MSRDYCVLVRLNPEKRDRIERAAKEEGTTLTHYLRWSAMRNAKRVEKETVHAPADRSQSPVLAR